MNIMRYHVYTESSSKLARVIRPSLKNNLFTCESVIITKRIIYPNSVLRVRDKKKKMSSRGRSSRNKILIIFYPKSHLISDVRMGIHNNYNVSECLIISGKKYPSIINFYFVRTYILFNRILCVMCIRINDSSITL